jgi:hypothetical protein
VAGTVDIRRRRRPKLVWAIVLFNGFSFLVGVVVATAIAVRWSTLPAPAKEQFHRLSMLDWILSGAGAVLGIYATIELFRLRRSSFRLYCVALLVELIITVRALFDPSIELKPLPTIFALSTGFFVCWYTLRLTEKGILE